QLAINRPAFRRTVRIKTSPVPRRWLFEPRRIYPKGADNGRHVPAVRPRALAVQPLTQPGMVRNDVAQGAAASCPVPAVHGLCRECCADGRLRVSLPARPADLLLRCSV